MDSEGKIRHRRTFMTNAIRQNIADKLKYARTEI